MKAGDRVQLTPEARADQHLYGDIGTRAGIVKAIDGFVVVEFAGLSVTPRIPERT